MLLTRAMQFLAMLCLAAFSSAVPLLAEQRKQAEFQPTRTLSDTDVERLRTVQGMTLQWISWAERGKVSAGPDEEGVWRLTGTQYDESGAGVQVSGVITEIGKDYFLLDGRITIGDTPDIGRHCDATRVWRFAATQRRAYYRLREFEWCDHLTDYIDIYFAPGLR